MAKSKRTITRDSVFRDISASDNTRNEGDVPKRGLLLAETRTRQTAVWLRDEEVERLDSQCRTIQRGGWRGRHPLCSNSNFHHGASEHHNEL